jgi:hypothetical protein
LLLVVEVLVDQPVTKLVVEVVLVVLDLVFLV